MYIYVHIYILYIIHIYIYICVCVCVCACVCVRVCARVKGGVSRLIRTKMAHARWNTHTSTNRAFTLL